MHDLLEMAAQAQRLAAITAPARVLIFGSLYVAGEVLADTQELPD